MKKEFHPNLRTPLSDYSKEELNKLNSNSMRGTLREELKSDSDDLSWQAEQIAKSYGIYMQFNRASTGTEKDWMYMLRVTVPGGGPIAPDVWAVLDEIADQYTVSASGVRSLRLTTRQNVQFHWVKKSNVAHIVRRLAESGLSSLNGCGDNVRNVMACPLASYSDIFDANAWAKRISAHFELPQSPFIEIFEIDRSQVDAEADDENKKFSYGDALLNRKFKMAVGSVRRDETTGTIVPDNCVEIRTNDLAAAPVFSGDQLTGFQIYIGGGQGERNGKPSMSTLASPFAFVKEEHLLEVLSAVVAVHQDWGDRQNRHWARIKYVVKKMGVQWFRERVEEIVGFKLSEPLSDHDTGSRCLHHGWFKQSNGLFAYGAFIENGRLTNASENGRLKVAIRDLSSKYNAPVVITPNQDIIFVGIADQDRERFIFDLEGFGYGQRNGQPYSALRMKSGACVGKDTCRLAYTDSEKFEPELIDELERRGWGGLQTSIGVTGCERQCFRPATKAIGLIGTGLNMYQLKLMGTEDGRHQGVPLTSPDGRQMYLRMIPRDQVAIVIDALFSLYVRERLDSDEEPGYFFRRFGMEAIIAYLKTHKQTSHTLEKEFSTADLLNVEPQKKQTFVTTDGACPISGPVESGRLTA